MRGLINIMTNKPNTPDPNDIPAEMIDEAEEEEFGIQKMSPEDGIDRMTRRIAYLKGEIITAMQTIENMGEYPLVVDKLLADIRGLRTDIAEAEFRLSEYQTQNDGRN